jgi:hypothetical protein
MIRVNFFTAMHTTLIALPILLISGCGANAANTQVEYSVLHESYYNEQGKYTSKSAVVIRDSNDYESELLKRSVDTPEVIDFSQATILLIDMGARGSGGYDIQLTTIVDRNELLTATIELSIPGRGCVVTHAITNPYKFIMLASNKEVLVSEKWTVQDCD